MINKVIQFMKHDLKERVLAALLFSVAFTVIGVGYPVFHYTYIDRTDFAYFGDKSGNKTNLLIADKLKYKTGDRVVLSAYRFSKIELPAVGIRELKLINFETGQLIEVQKIESKGIIDYSPKGEYISFAISDMPSNIPKGKYFYKGIITYQLRSFVERSLIWQSTQFIVE